MTRHVYAQLALWGAVLVWSASTAQALCVTYQPWSGLAWPAPAYAPGVLQRSCFKVDPGMCVELDTDVHVDSLWVAGALRFVDGADRVLNAHKIILDGVMEVGTATDRFTSNASLELTDLTAAEVNCVDTYSVDAAGVVTGPMAPTVDFHPEDIQNRTFLVRGAATLDMHGKQRASTWKFLDATAYAANANSYATVKRGDDWDPGDTIVLASTDYDISQAEVRTITNIMPIQPQNVSHALQMPALNHTHWSGRAGAAVVPKVFEDGEVGLLSHNIKIFSPDRVATMNSTDTCTLPADLDYSGAEIRIIQDAGISPTVRLENVEVYNAGKAGNEDVEKGHYPVHFHELGAVPGSYVRGISVHTSGNRAIVVHGTQQLLVEDNVVYNVAGHAYYLEPMEENLEAPEAPVYDTIHNIFRHNLGVSIQCNPLDVGALGNDNSNVFSNSSVFYFEDPRNVFMANAAAGAVHSGFYWAQSNAMEDAAGNNLNAFHLCGEGAIDYATTDHELLNTEAFVIDEALAPYGEADYARFADPDTGEVRCHGTFAHNIAHSAQTAFWAEEHKDTLVRLGHFLAYKNLRRGVSIKNQGFTEVVGLMAADNATAVWPASHAYHLWNSPQFLLVDSHVVGLSQNVSPMVLEKLYGVEVYEGRLHVANTYFERFETGFATVAVAAIGRHQSFPFYSNNPDNSVSGVTFDAATNKLWFDDPGPNASGEATVMLHDLDGSLVGADPWIVPNDVFMAPLTGATWDAISNLYTVDPAQSYGQIIVHWCDSSPALDCNDRRQRSPWRQTGNGPGTFGVVMGLTLRDLTECPGACNSDVLEADHSNDGEHNSLGGNALAGHDYEVTYVDAAWVPLSSADLTPITAMEIHWRYAPVGATVTVRVPVPSVPQTVTLLRGERTVSEETLGAPLLVGPPASALEWSYDAATSKVWLRLDAQTDAAIDRANAAVLMLF